MAAGHRGVSPRMRGSGSPAHPGRVGGRKGCLMSLYLLDTDHISLYQMGHPRVPQQILGHIHDQLAVTVIMVEEQLSGWQRALRQARDDSRRAEVYRRMALAIENLSGWLV